MKALKYGGTHGQTTYELAPLAFSACHDYCTAMHDLAQDLVLKKAEMEENYMLIGDGGQAEIRGWETSRLQRQLSTTIQKAPTFRALR